VKDGIIRAVSVGYKVYKVQEDTPKDGGVPTRTAIDWEPYEISMVSMPADVGAKVRAGDKSHTNPCVIVTVSNVTDADRLRRFRLAAAAR
jgi:phage head maturation protease